MIEGEPIPLVEPGDLGGPRRDHGEIDAMLIPAEPANLADAISVQEPCDLLRRRALAGDADRRTANPIRGDRRWDTVSRGNRRLTGHATEVGGPSTSNPCAARRSTA